MIVPPTKYYPGDEIRRMKRAGHVACIGDRTDANRLLVGKPECKRQLGTPGRRREDNIKTYLQEIGSESLDCTDLAQDRACSELL
jgi:hypothetical protein